MTIADRMPIFWLSVRQFRHGKSTLIVGLFALIPILFGVINALSSGQAAGSDFIAQRFLDVVLPTVIPLATLILATTVLGSEISDRTLPYLTLKPVQRGRIILAKYASTVFVAAVAFAIGLGITWLIASTSGSHSPSGSLGALYAGAIASIAAYGALFLLVSLLINRALIAGVIYILLWETILSRFISGVKLLSLRHFSQSIFVRVADDPAIKLARALQLSSAIVAILVIVAVSLILATVRLQRMNLH